MRVQTDILLDVVRAADPVKSADALNGIATFEGRTSPPGSGFESKAVTHFSSSAFAYPGESSVAPRRISSARDAEAGLQTILLKKMIEDMMPQAPKSKFGGGTAGDMWRSQLADQMAQTISRANPHMLGLNLEGRMEDGGSAAAVEAGDVSA